MNSLSHAKAQRRKDIEQDVYYRAYNTVTTSLMLYLHQYSQQLFAPLRLCVRTLLLLPLLLLTACGDPETGPVDVTWDRDNCDRCVMALSDRHHSAQVRGGERHKAYHFDDLGCALLWLEEQPWRDNPKTEIWVNDYQTGAWLNARTAHYVKLTHTPMNYGFSAQPTPSEGSVDFETAREAIFKQESEYHASVEARLKHREQEAKR